MRRLQSPTVVGTGTDERFNAEMIRCSLACHEPCKPVGKCSQKTCRRLFASVTKTSSEASAMISARTICRQLMCSASSSRRLEDASGALIMTMVVTAGFSRSRCVGRADRGEFGFQGSVRRRRRGLRVAGTRTFPTSGRWLSTCGRHGVAMQDAWPNARRSSGGDRGRVVLAEVTLMKIRPFHRCFRCSRFLRYAIRDGQVATDSLEPRAVLRSMHSLGGWAQTRWQNDPRSC